MIRFLRTCINSSAHIFTRDWCLDDEDWEGVIDRYASDHPEAEPLDRLAQEIDGLSAAHPEPDLEQFLHYTVVCSYRSVSVTYKEWLGQVADRSRRHAAAIDTGNTPQR
jgi:hypothetical protein